VRDVAERHDHAAGALNEFRLCFLFLVPGAAPPSTAAKATASRHSQPAIDMASSKFMRLSVMSSSDTLKDYEEPWLRRVFCAKQALSQNPPPQLVD